MGTFDAVDDVEMEKSVIGCAAVATEKEVLIAPAS
jgi:hypothetical protein